MKTALLCFCLLLFDVNLISDYTYDVLIEGTRIIDGTGTEGFIADIAIKNGKIQSIGSVNGKAAITIDGSGLITCPGFIDPHTHADGTILEYPQAENFIMQGVTTVIAGNCGWSPAPEIGLTFGDWLSRVEKTGISINYAPLVGHNAIRLLVMGDDFKRQAKVDEIAEMKIYAEEAMLSGAFGFSVGLDPGPGHFAHTEELVELAKTVHEYEGIFVPHTRHTQTQWPTDNPEEVGYGIFLGPIEDAYIGRYRGYIEAIEVVKRTGIRLNIAHMGSAYVPVQPHPDFLEEAGARATLEEIIDKSRETGHEVSFDIMAYDGNISRKQKLREGIYSSSPALEWMEKLELEEYQEKIKTADFRNRVRKILKEGRLKLGMIHTKAFPYWMDCFKILTCTNKNLEGKTIAEISKLRNTGPIDTLFDILLDDFDTVWVQFFDPRMHPATIPVLLQHPFSMPSTDVVSLPADPGENLPVNPIAFGLFPHYIKRYVRELRVLSLEEAIRKATSLPANIFGLKNRGIIKEGNWADILVFNLDEISDKGDFLHPAKRPEGITHVLVNGVMVYQGMSHTGDKPGRVLRRNGNS